MMKKHNLRGKIVFSVMLLGFFTLSINNVRAEDEEKDDAYEPSSVEISCKDATDKQKCIEYSTKCISYLKSFNNTITFVPEGNSGKAMYNDKELSASGTMNVSGKTINYTKRIENDPENTEDEKATSIIIDSNYTYKVGDVEYPCSGTKKHTFVNYNPSFTKDAYANPARQEDGICYKYLNGLETGDSKLDSKNAKGEKENSYAYLNKKSNNKFKEYFDKYVSYCNQEYVTDISPDNKIISLIKTAISNYDVEVTYGSGNSKTNYSNDDVWLKGIPKLTKTDVSLTCDAFGPTAAIQGVNRTNSFTTRNGITVNQRVFYKEEKVKDVDVTYVTGTDSNNKPIKETKKLCEVTCAEKVTTTYYPPITVIAGTCFQYEIEVKSELKCNTNYNPDAKPPVITERRTCEFQPVCTYSGGTTHYQAGPNEDFEECISTKFKGKYTQKAINYCYNKVYKKKNKNKVSSNLEEITATKVANNNNKKSYKDYWWCDVSNPQFTVENAYKIAQAVYKAYTTDGFVGGEFTQEGNGTGIYNKNGGKIDWKPYDSSEGSVPKDSSVKYIDGCYWNKYAPFYFSTLTHSEGTVYNDYYIAVANSSSGAITSSIPNNQYISKLAANNARSVTGRVGNLGVLRQNYLTNVAHVRPASSPVANSWYTPSINGKSELNYYRRGWLTNRYKVQDVTGIKWANHTVNNTNYICGDTCSYVIKGDTNCALNLSTLVTSSDYNEQNQTAYKAGIAKCSTDTVCKEDTVKYSFQVQKGGKDNNGTAKINVCSYKNKTKNSSDCITWSQTNTKQNKIINYNKNEKSIIQSVQGTCAGNTKAGTYKYWDIIDFYGWPTSKGINYFGTPVKGAKYGFKPHEFCVPDSAPEINKLWGQWDQGTEKFKEFGVRYTAEINKVLSIFGSKVKIATDTTGTKYYRYDDNYNIYGKIENFGHFGWNIDYSCYYSVIKSEECKNPPCKTHTEKGSSTENDTRTISLDKPFPGSGE